MARDISPVRNMDAQRVIRNEAEARIVGQRWAYLHGHSQVRMSDFAAYVYRSAGKPAFAEHFLFDELRRFADATAAVHKQWHTYGSQEWKLRDDWILETVKHLAAINTAGLAGAVALFVTHQSFALKLAFGVFGFGLLLAVIDLFVNAKAHYLNGMRANSLRLSANQAKSWEDLDETANAKSSSDTGDACTQCAEVAGAVSAFLAIAGMISLVVHLNSLPA